MYDTIVSMLSRLMLMLSHNINRNAKQLTSPGVPYHCTLLTIRFLNLGYFEFLSVKLDSWIFRVEILVDQFSGSNYEKIKRGVKTFQQLCSMTSTFFRQNIGSSFGAALLIMLFSY